MARYIVDYKNVDGLDQYEKIKEEVIEAKREYAIGRIEKEKQELCDIIQACYTRFMQLGMSKEDIEKEWELHYKKETLRGRKVIEIPGINSNEILREDLLRVIANLEREVENWKPKK